MKNIKSYKIFESKEESVLADVKEICLELEESGFESVISKIGPSVFRLEIKKLNKSVFIFDKLVKDTVVRLSNYLDNFEVMFNRNNYQHPPITIAKFRYSMSEDDHRYYKTMNSIYVEFKIDEKA